MAKRKRALAFPREPDDTLAAKLKALDVEELEDVLGPALDLLKTEPRIHQLVSTIIGIDNPTWLFANDMGSGKTKVAIDVYTIRRAMGEARRVLVACPPIVMRHWAREVAKHSDHSVELVEGTAKDKTRIFFESRADFVVCSMNWITRLLSVAMDEGKGENRLIDRVEDFDVLIIDEAHALKNPETKGFQGFADYLIDVPFRYLLTGTPVGNDYTGVWSLYYLLDYGETYLPSFDMFLRKWFYIVPMKSRFAIRRLHKHKSSDFFDRFWDKAIRYEESELADLPARTRVPIAVDMNRQQLRLYADLLTRDPGNPEEVEASIWELMRVTGGCHEDLDHATTPSPKLEALQWIVDEVVLTRGDPIIVWHWLNPEGGLIVEWLRSKMKGLKIGEARGGISTAKKNTAIDAWYDGNLDVFVANPASLGLGVDLFETNVAVYYSNSFSLIHRSQSEKRIHRDGQTRHCYYYDLTCSGTVDELVVDALLDKKDAFRQLTRDQAWQDCRRRFA